MSLKSNERSEYSLDIILKTTQENLYQKLLKLIRENPLKILRLLSRGHFDNRVCEVLKNPIISGFYQ